MSKVRIIPKSQRAQNRINEHGEIMILLIPGQKFLVESVGNTWQGSRWLGWFTNDEAEFERISE